MIIADDLRLKNGGPIAFDQLAAQISAFRNERDCEQFLSPLNLAASIGIEAAKLLDLSEWSSDTTLAEDIEASRRHGMRTGRRSDLRDAADARPHSRPRERGHGEARRNAEKHAADRARGLSAKYTEP